MRVEVEEVTALRFADSSPVRAASALALLGSGWLVAQDDATHACWLVGGVGAPVRLFPAIEGHDAFSEATRTKHLKPDVEAAVEVSVDGTPAVLMLGSGSTPARMRSVLVTLQHQVPTAQVADLSPVAKVEGLSVLDWAGSGGDVLAVVDADDPEVASSMLRLRVVR